MRIPAVWNSLVGIKPTLGLLGRTGVIPASDAFDVPGPLARSVADAAAMLAAMSGVDPDDPATDRQPLPPPDYQASLREDGLDGARLGVLRETLGVPLSGQNEAVDAALAHALEAMGRRGATLVDPVAVAEVVTDDQILAAVTTLGSERFPPDLNAYLASEGRGAPLRTFDDLLSAARALGPEVVRNLAVFEKIAGTPPPTAEEVAGARATQAALTAAIVAALDGAGVDALVFPTMLCPATPPGSGVPGVVDDAYRCTSAPPMPFSFGEAYGGEAILMASIAGLPEITVPAGYAPDGTSIGVSFLGRAFSEATLIRLAYSFEQTTHLRVPPDLGSH